MNNFRTFKTTVFNIDDISIVSAVDTVEEWGEDCEDVKYMLIVLKSGIRLSTDEETFHKFNGDSNKYLEYIFASKPNIDVS